MTRPGRAHAILVCVLCLLAVGCPGGKPPEVPGRVAAKARDPHAKKPLGFRLGNDDSQLTATPRAKPAPATPLSEPEAKALAARLPPVAATPDDARALSFPARSLAPPRAGKTTEEPFPPAAPAGKPPGASTAAPLVVERHAPEGPVAIAPQLSVTFSQPMVAASTLDQLAAQPPPVKVTPQPPGAWQWLGTRTVTFRPEPRFAMATDYVVEIPAGTTAASGAKVPAAVRWTFSTPAPKLVRTHPSGTAIARTPLLFAELDQRDDRVEAFASLVREGVHEYTYVARATTTGVFVAPPAKAEEMYAPETFGRGASERVTVVE